MTFVTAIVLAAGKGVRLKSKTPKPLVKINSKPVLVYSLEKLSSLSEIQEIILVVNSANSPAILKEIESPRTKVLGFIPSRKGTISFISRAKSPRGFLRGIKKYKFSKINKIVFGGRLRQDSVRNGLEVLDKRSQLVLIHDSARPLIQMKEIRKVILAAKKTGAAVLGVPVKGTIKRGKGHGARGKVVAETLNRDELWEIQTPQVFRRDIILEAYRRFGKTPVTDDAMLVEKLGKRVSIVMGSYGNIKITTPEDLVVAKTIAKKSP